MTVLKSKKYIKIRQNDLKNFQIDIKNEILTQKCFKMYQNLEKDM